MIMISVSRSSIGISIVSWLIDSRRHCSRRKLAAMLKGVMNVGNVHCFDGAQKDPLCDQLKRTQGVAFYPRWSHWTSTWKGRLLISLVILAMQELSSLDAKDLMNSAIQLLPDLSILSEDQVEVDSLLRDILFSLSDSLLRDILFFLWFYSQRHTVIHSYSEFGQCSIDVSIADTRLFPSVFDGWNGRGVEETSISSRRCCHGLSVIGGTLWCVKVGVVDCSQLSTLCAKLNFKLPTMVLFKENGYEINYGMG